MNRFLSKFIAHNMLPQQYADLADQYYIPLAHSIYASLKRSDQTLVVGLNGCQGSGKSTLSDFLVKYLEDAFDLNALAVSLDDFYLTKEERKRLSEEVHPLLATRGVPGTHDTSLMLQVFEQVKQHQYPIDIPRFNKATDDRCPKEQWSKVSKPLDLLIVEGWCWGAEAEADETLIEPINELEASEDSASLWRSYANQKLQTVYTSLYDYMDLWVMLKAPSFGCVYQWRLEQEEKLALKLKDASEDAKAGIMSSEQVARFVQFYQRITENILVSLPRRADYRLDLDDERQVISLNMKNNEFETIESER